MYTLNLTPAYGRDYKSKKAILADIVRGKDFILNRMAESGIVNYDDLVGPELSGWDSLQCRYGQLRKVCVIKHSEVVKARDAWHQERQRKAAEHTPTSAPTASGLTQSLA